MPATPLLAAAVTLGDHILHNLVTSWIRKGAPDAEEYFGVSDPPDPALVAPWEEDPEHFWSVEGMRRLVRRLAQRGANRLYWRVCGGGDPLYPSRLVRSRQLRHLHPVLQRRLDLPAGFGDFAALDYLSPVVQEAHERGIEIDAWFTGGEEDHGASGVVGEFAEAHPEFLQETRAGEKLSGNLSFAFPEVLAYKQRLVAEFLDFGFDGLLLDCTRECGGFSHRRLSQPIVRNGERRVPQGGYEAPVREACERELGMDPRKLAPGSEGFELFWSFKTRHYPTPLVRLCAEEAHKRKIPAEVMIRSQDNFATYGLDVEHWIDAGWVDALLPVMPGLFYPGATHGYYLDETAPLAARFQHLQLQARGRVAVRWLNYFYPMSSVLGYFGTVKHPARGIPAIPPPGPMAEVVRGRRALAQTLKADGFVVFEADHPEAWGLWNALGA